MTDEELIKWMSLEYRRSEDLSLVEGKQVRHRAKIIFDKRFPNPDTCPHCMK